MKQNSERENILKEKFHWNKVRLKFLVQILIALITTRTVNLNKIACVIPSETEQLSRYRRLQRFFAHFSIDFNVLAGFLFMLFFPIGEKCYLTMDRTNWQWGKSPINILMLGIVYKGIAIPIYWTLLDKKGNSDTEERIQLIQKFINQFGKKCIAGIFGDREFIGGDWFAWMIKENIPFWMRIKKNFLTTDSRGRPVQVKTLFRGLQPMQEYSIYDKRNVMGADVYLSGLKLSNGDLRIVATLESPAMAISQYALRWEIETLFSCLKGRGFNFEDTHLINLERIQKLMGVLAIAFCWAHKTGEWLHEILPIKIKTHGRRAISLFRYGLDYLIDMFINIQFKPKNFKNFLRIIKSTNPNWEDLYEEVIF